MDIKKTELIAYICCKNEEHKLPIMEFLTFEKSVAEEWKLSHELTYEDPFWHSVKEIICTDDLKKLRAMISGKIGKRSINAEQQNKMQEARKINKKT